VRRSRRGVKIPRLGRGGPLAVGRVEKFSPIGGGDHEVVRGVKILCHPFDRNAQTGIPPSSAGADTSPRGAESLHWVESKIPRLGRGGAKRRGGSLNSPPTGAESLNWPENKIPRLGRGGPLAVGRVSKFSPTGGVPSKTGGG